MRCWFEGDGGKGRDRVVREGEKKRTLEREMDFWVKTEHCSAAHRGIAVTFCC